MFDNFLLNDSNPIKMMIMMPLLTTISNKAIELVEWLLKLLVYFLYWLGNKWAEKVKILARYKYYEIEVDGMTIYDIKNPDIAQCARALLWHWDKNKICTTEKLKYTSTKRYTDEDEEIINEHYVPFPSIIDAKQLTNLLDSYLGSKDKTDRSGEKISDSPKLFTKPIYLESEIYLKFGIKKRYSYHSCDNCACVSYTLGSTKGHEYIKAYISRIKKEYNKHIKCTLEELRGKMYVYKNIQESKPVYSEYEYDQNQTFENMFFDNKAEILKQLTRLEDIEYHKERGIKRKISLLLCGPSGTGKTALSNAIANHTGRVIVSIPISRISTNNEMEEILYSSNYNGNFIPLDKKIILLDEIDGCLDKHMSKFSNDESKEPELEDVPESDNEDDEHTKKESNKDIEDNTSHVPHPKKSKSKTNTDKFNFGMFLSLLDGANNQDGLIIIATANSAEKFDSTLFRDGRLKLMNMRYIGQEQIKEMIEKYYRIRLTEEQIKAIRSDHAIQNLTVKNLCLNSCDSGLDPDEFIEQLNKL